MSDTDLVETVDGDASPPAAAGRARGADGKFAGTAAADTGTAAPAVTGAAPTAVVTKPTAGTIATGAEVVTPPVPQTWPADWRELMAKDRAGGDADSPAYKKELKRLQQLTSPAAVWAKAAELETKFGEGGLVKIPGAKATDEERAAFNKALGVPEKPEDYATKIKLANNRVLGENDKEVFNYFATKMHPLGTTPSQMAGLTDAWLDYQQAVQETREESDDAFRTASQTALRKEWGGEYKAAAAVIATLVDSWPPAVVDIFKSGRDAAGNRLGDNIDLLKVLREVATELVPAGQNYGADGTNPASDELNTLRQKARDKPSEYTKADEERQTQLIAQQLAVQKRGKRAA